MHTIRHIEGAYHNISDDCQYFLVLQEDSSFTLSVKLQDASPKCTGKWANIDDKYIDLYCSESTNPSEILSNEYMQKRTYRLKILNSNKLIIEDVVLKKQN